ncbi:MAG: type IX secretion system membrane protein PorP/SprF [Flavobacteriales bacterium]
MKKIIFMVATLLMAGSAFAQQELMISQYMFNPLVLNPAYTGTHPYWQGTILHRSQWLKFDKAPTTQTLCLDGPVMDGKLGVGLNLSNDQIGLVKEFNAAGNVAGKVTLGAGYLSAGLRIGLSRYSANLTDAVIWDTEDPVYAANLKGQTSIRLGMGLYYYTRNWFAGLAIPSIAAADEDISFSSDGFNSYYRNHYYLSAGYVFEPSPDFAIKPSTLIKIQGNAPVELDLNCNVLFLNKFWFGAGWRTGDALVAMAEWNVSSQLRIGYAFDYTLTQIADYSSNSHEVMLGYDFGKEVELKARSPRYF